jgi:hypothetical protein
LSNCRASPEGSGISFVRAKAPAAARTSTADEGNA